MSYLLLYLIPHESGVESSVLRATVGQINILYVNFISKVIYSSTRNSVYSILRLILFAIELYTSRLINYFLRVCDRATLRCKYYAVKARLSFVPVYMMLCLYERTTNIHGVK